MDDPGKDKLLENEKMNDGEDDAAADARYYANTKETLTEIKNGSGDKHDTRFVCTIFDQVDHMGHSYGFSKNVPQYMNALKVVDEYSQDLINIVKSDTTHH
jgi:predicted AlkP superfamily pyrophosphatase or phosphodiesterase